MILLTPGPCMTTESVRLAGAAPDMNHRDPAYGELIGETKRRLLSVYPDTQHWIPYLLGGSGTAAVEAMVTSCVNRGPVLVVENGYYSGRIAEILEIHRIPQETLSFDWEQPVDPSVVAEILRGGAFEAVLLTHHETTLGALNPVEQIAREAKRCGVKVLVDAMSGFGADPLNFGPLDAVAASANKCLHGLPGVSFVLASPEMARTMAPDRTYYLSLPRYEGDIPPLTPPVPALMAFRQALREFTTAAERQVRYLDLKQVVTSKLDSLGVNYFANGPTSSTLVSIEIPSGWTYDALFERFYAQGFVIYGCKRHLRERFFQISWMGAVTREHLERWLDEFRRLGSLNT